jgi:hypothetical protein
MSNHHQQQQQQQHTGVCDMAVSFISSRFEGEAIAKSGYGCWGATGVK